MFRNRGEPTTVGSIMEDLVDAKNVTTITARSTDKGFTL
jgi:hypothetical protein